MLNFADPIPLALYIHLPWCIQKCPYCDFNSHALRDALPEEAYINALIADLNQQLPKLAGRSIISIFIGGGTPSLFSAAALARLLNTISSKVNLLNCCEITLEANPGTVEQSRFADYRAIGINRLSLGVQSFQNDKLKTLGRIHDGQTAQRAVNQIQTAGFDNFNIDLMYGLPQQSIKDALFDLETALKFNPPHLSCYQLTLEPNTLFYKQPPPLPETDLIWEMQTQLLTRLQNAGYNQYEVSAYSQVNFQCQHNRNYWEFGDYLGIGAGAHSKITDPVGQQIYRAWRFKHPRTYMDISKAFVEEEKTIPLSEIPFEFMLNALRLKQAIPFKLFEQRTGLKQNVIIPILNKGKQQGLLHFDNMQINLTNQGWNFLNNVLQLFMPDA